LASWKNFGPSVRREVVEALMPNRSGLHDLFAAIESKQVGRGEIDRDVKQLLMSHPDPEIRRRAHRLFEIDLPSDRSRIVATYRRGLDVRGNADRGRAIYEQRCSICHRARERGHAVGPDLMSVQNKSPADLLLAILDPSREMQPNYVAYTLVTNRGEVRSGIIAAESSTAVTLRRAEGKEDRVLRTDIEELVSTGKSLMPEGFEKDISVAQMADLIAYIKSL
jgi:putative heme-binding domain-containing protein